MKPLLSIIVTIYNKEKYIAEALESVINQSIREIEIICVDDGSMDRSGIIADEYAKQDSRITVFHQKNQGQVSARKLGIVNANAKYIGFVDADDWVEADMFQRLYQEMTSKELDFISSGIIEHDEYIKLDALDENVYDLEEDGKKVFSKLLWNAEKACCGIIANAVTKLYKKEILVESCIGIDNRIHFREDDCLVYSYVVQCKTIGILHEAYYHYRFVENSDVHTTDERFFERQNCFYLFLKNRFKRTMYYDILIPQLDRYFVETLICGINHMAGLTLDAYIHTVFIFEGKKRVVVYGAGRRGKKIINKILESKNYVMVAVIDKNINLKEIRGYRVQNIESIKSMEFDLVVIAIANEKVSRQVYNMFIKLGIPKEKLAIG